MKYFKTIIEGYIVALTTNYGTIEITKEEYEEILTVIKNKPEPDSGYEYRLKEDLTWELYELPPEPDPPDYVDDAEAIAAIEEALA